MKLNKMLALALSGVMAVSMLAGCSGAPSNGEEGQEQPPVAATGAAAVLNDEQDIIEFTNGSTTQLELATSMLNANEMYANGLVVLSNTNKVYNNLEDMGVENLTNSWASKFNTNQDPDKAETTVVVFAVKGTDKSMNNALKAVANDQIKEGLKKEEVVGGKLYTYSYTGSVSAVTATSIDGTTSTNYVMLTITRNLAKRDIDVK